MYGATPLLDRSQWLFIFCPPLRVFSSAHRNGFIMSSDSFPPDDPRGRDGSLPSPDSTESLSDDELLAQDLDYGLSDPDDSSNWGLVIGVLVAMAAITFLVFDGMQGETYFFDVHELQERQDALVDETVRVRGDVEAGSYVGKDGHVEHEFRIASQGETMTIIYHRALPDTFEDGSEIVAEGTLQSGMVLKADEVLVKCPSRYEGAPPAHDDGYDGYDDGDYDTDDYAALDADDSASY